jgi:hypothetical protein
LFKQSTADLRHALGEFDIVGRLLAKLGRELLKTEVGLVHQKWLSGRLPRVGTATRGRICAVCRQMRGKNEDNRAPAADSLNLDGQQWSKNGGRHR